jgi:hypothetical protein
VEGCAPVEHTHVTNEYFVALYVVISLLMIYIGWRYKSINVKKKFTTYSQKLHLFVLR